MRRSVLIAAGTLAAMSLVLTTISLTRWVERPTTLRVAVSSTDAEDYDLMLAAAKLAKRGHHAVRLKLVPTDGVVNAAHALDAGSADVAVVRADAAMPDKGATVVMLHKDAVLLVAPGGSAIAKIGDLAGKRIGVVSKRLGDSRVLDTALAQYDIAASDVTLVPLEPANVTAAVKDKTVDAVYVVGLTSTGLLPEVVKAVAKASDEPPVFLPVAEAAAIAERQPTLEAMEVVRGAFGGTPPRPSEDIDTLGVTYRLVASTDLPDDTVGALTRFLLSERVALADLAPIARRMTAPATDRGAAIPVHSGSAAYIDDEEETFLDRYSDFIYIGAMVLGVVASGLTAVVSRIGSARGVPVEQFVARLLTILKQVRTCPRPAMLDQFEEDVDAIVAEALDGASLKTLDERRAAALTMAIDQVRTAIHDRREALARTALMHANDEGRASYETLMITRSVDRAGETT